MACCGSTVGKKFPQLYDMEFEIDDDASPKVLYDRDSTKDDPDQLFIQLAELAIDSFKKPESLKCRLLKLVKVTSVVCNGVMLTLTMTADLRGNKHELWNEEDQTLESKIWYRGCLVEMKALVMYVKVCYRKKETTRDLELHNLELEIGKPEKDMSQTKDETGEEKPSMKNPKLMSYNKVVQVEYSDKRVPELHDVELGSETEEERPAMENPELMTDDEVSEGDFSDWDDDEVYPKVVYDRNSTDDDGKQLFTELAELAICFFNKDNPHMPYEVLKLHEVTASPGVLVTYTLTMTAKPKPPHDAKPNALVQNFKAIISYEGGPAMESHVLKVTTADPSLCW